MDVRRRWAIRHAHGYHDARDHARGVEATVEVIGRDLGDQFIRERVQDPVNSSAVDGRGQMPPESGNRDGATVTAGISIRVIRDGIRRIYVGQSKHIGRRLQEDRRVLSADKAGRWVVEDPYGEGPTFVATSEWTPATSRALVESGVHSLVLNTALGYQAQSLEFIDSEWSIRRLGLLDWCESDLSPLSRACRPSAAPSAAAPRAAAPRPCRPRRPRGPCLAVAAGARGAQPATRCSSTGSRRFPRGAGAARHAIAVPTTGTPHASHASCAAASVNVFAVPAVPTTAATGSAVGREPPHPRAGELDRVVLGQEVIGQPLEERDIDRHASGHRSHQAGGHRGERTSSAAS
jgi:hypothetical protein